MLTIHQFKTKTKTKTKTPTFKTKPRQHTEQHIK